MENQIQKHQPKIYQLLTNQATKAELISRFGSLTVQQIAHEEFPSIGQLQREHGEQKTLEAIATILTDLNKSFGNDLDQEQMLDIIANVVNGINRNITLEGFYLTCQEIKCNSTYGKLTSNKVLTAIKKHLNEQMNAYQLKHYNQHLATKESAERTKTNPFDEPAYRKIKAERLASEIIKKGK